MENPVKITKEEQDEINALQNEVSKKIFDMGRLGAEKIEIDQIVQSFVEKEQKLRKDWIDLQGKQKEFVDKLIKKYGEGELDIKEGTFSPSN